MDTEEAIKFVENDILTISIINQSVEEYYEKIHNIVALLKRGEKFEKIVEEITEILPKPHYVYKNCRGKEFEHYCNANAIELIDNIKQKYFLKEDIRNAVND